jgi:phosphoribosylformylglycinamidine synthase
MVKDEQGDDQGNDRAMHMLAPVSLVITAFAPVTDARLALTPELKDIDDETRLLLIDLGHGQDRMGGSALEQVNGAFSENVPDLDEARDLAGLFAAIQEMTAAGQLLAYHDRSDGGLITTVCEMAFAGRCGLSLALDNIADDGLRARLFAEEPGAVVQVAESQLAEVMDGFAKHGLENLVGVIGKPVEGHGLSISTGGNNLLESDLRELHRAWCETSFEIQKLRDHPDCADEEFARSVEWQQPLLKANPSFDPQLNPAAPYIASGIRPSIAM